MTLKQWTAIGVLALLPFAASAQQASRQPNPLDMNATVPVSIYESAFTSYQATADEQASPDKVWRAANDEMARLGGHAGHVKEEATATSPLVPSAPAPGKNTSAPAQAMPMDHSKHH
ncbi:MAG: hypothetical protein JWQ23_3618 [Herminiimonas sp.]|nr:hypothetical protein [Herminiimonas sp.]